MAAQMAERAAVATTGREILAVEFAESRARVVAEVYREEGRSDVKVHREKIKAESTWRWGWVVVADARGVG